MMASWFNLVLQPTVNLFFINYGWSVFISMAFWAVIMGITIKENDDLIPAGGCVFVFGLFTPIVLTFLIVLLPVFLTILVVIALVILLVYGIKCLKEKTLREKK